MEFWGVKVPAGEPAKVTPEEGDLIHVTQAALDGDDSTVLSVKVGGNKFRLGELSRDRFPHVSFNLVFEQDFELYHNGEGIVDLVGYKSPDVELDEGSGSDEDEPAEGNAPAAVTNVVKADEEDGFESDEEEKTPKPTNKKRPTESPASKTKKAKKAKTGEKKEKGGQSSCGGNKKPFNKGKGKGKV